MANKATEHGNSPLGMDILQQLLSGKIPPGSLGGVAQIKKRQSGRPVFVNQDDEMWKIWEESGNAIQTNQPLPQKSNFIPTWPAADSTSPVGIVFKPEQALSIVYLFTMAERDQLDLNQSMFPGTVFYVQETQMMYINENADLFTRPAYSTSNKTVYNYNAGPSWVPVYVDPTNRRIHRLPIAEFPPPELEIILDKQQEEKYLEFEKNLVLKQTPGRLDNEEPENDIVKQSEDSGPKDISNFGVSPITGYIN